MIVDRVSDVVGFPLSAGVEATYDALELSELASHFGGEIALGEFGGAIGVGDDGLVWPRLNHCSASQRAMERMRSVLSR